MAGVVTGDPNAPSVRLQGAWLDGVFYEDVNSEKYRAALKAREVVGSGPHKFANTPVSPEWVSKFALEEENIKKKIATPDATDSYLRGLAANLTQPGSMGLRNARIKSVPRYRNTGVSMFTPTQFY